MAAPTQSYILDGSGDYITVADHGDFDCATHISMGLWFRMDGDQHDTHYCPVYLMARESWFDLYLERTSPPGNGRKYLGAEAYRVVWNVEGKATIRSNVDYDESTCYGGLVVPEKRHFVCAVATESGTSLILSIYIDGKLAATKTFSSTTLPAAAATAIYIGADHDGDKELKGTVSSIFMTDDLVTAAEISTIFASASGQATGVLDNLVIDIDTEGDLVNAGSAGNGTANGNAAARTYMDLWQGGYPCKQAVIPSAETGYYTAQRLMPQEFRWVDATTADHNCILKDGNGIIIWDSECDGADFVDSLVWPIDGSPIRGLDVDTLDSGLLYLYFR